MENFIDIFNKLWEHSENEVVEFKKAETNFDVDELVGCISPPFAPTICHLKIERNAVVAFYSFHL